MSVVTQVVKKFINDPETVGPGARAGRAVAPPGPARPGPTPPPGPGPARARAAAGGSTSCGGGRSGA